MKPCNLCAVRDVEDETGACHSRWSAKDRPHCVIWNYSLWSAVVWCVFFLSKSSFKMLFRVQDVLEFSFKSNPSRFSCVVCRVFSLSFFLWHFLTGGPEPSRESCGLRGALADTLLFSAPSCFISHIQHRQIQLKHNPALWLISLA